jgi:V-type H+-transporting ATPase proteolipid subunit
MIPIIMAGILGIYGLIIAILMSSKAGEANLSAGTGYKLFSAGMCCGLSALASGLAIGTAGEAGVKAYA